MSNNGNKSRVYVTCETNHDFSMAEEFGSISFLTADDLNNSKASIHNSKVLADIQEKLEEFDPENDWVLVAGSPYISASVFLMLGLMGIDSVKILRWNNRDFVYQPLYLDLPRGSI